MRRSTADDERNFLDHAIRHPERLTPDGALRLFDSVQHLRADIDILKRTIMNLDDKNQALKAKVLDALAHYYAPENESVMTSKFMDAMYELDKAVSKEAKLCR